jgi:tripartite ATP-independent transporter DctM subunit
MGIYVYYISKKRSYPIGERVTLKAFFSSTFKAIPALLTPVVLLSGIYTGVMTPTEAGAVAALYTIIIAVFVYRTLRWKAFGKILLNTLRTTGTIFLVIASAFAFNYIISNEQVADAIVSWMTSVISSPAMFLIVVNIVFLILGCLVDVNVSELVILPMVLPLVHYYGIDLVHFGVMICLNMMIGLMTPPFGMLLFITAGIGNISLKEMIRESMPLIGTLIVALIIVTFVPDTVLFMTRLIK